MAIKMFLNIDQVPGEAQDKDYKDTIEVQGWNWGVSQTAPSRPSPGTGVATGRPIIQDLSVTKWIDKATPKIYELALQGATIRQCVLTCCRTDGGKSLEFDLLNCTLVNVSTGGRNIEDKLTETLAIHFGR